MNIVPKAGGQRPGFRSRTQDEKNPEPSRVFGLTEPELAQLELVCHSCVFVSNLKNKHFILCVDAVNRLPVSPVSFVLDGAVTGWKSPPSVSSPGSAAGDRVRLR